MLRAARAVLGDRAVLVWSELERLGVPGIVGVSKHWGLTIIAVKQAFPGHAMRAAMGALGGIAGYYGKYVILVDDDINPYDLDEVIWAIATRSQPSESIDILRRTWTNRIDPRMDPWKRERGDLTGSVAIIDATRPFHWRDRFPPTIAMEQELRRSTEAKWGSMLDG
jgi:4-hydroxy-3-polyprenylbenzoate decarboxylase